MTLKDIKLEQFKIGIKKNIYDSIKKTWNKINKRSARSVNWELQWITEINQEDL